MGPVKIEADVTSDWLLYEEDDIGRYSRQNVVVAVNQTLVDGQVVGVNSSGEIQAYDDETVTDAGGATAIGILIGSVTTGAATIKGVILARHARVASAKLKWKAGLGSTPKANGLADLALLGIHTVTSV